jgi:general secretion pathway protein G
MKSKQTILRGMTLVEVLAVVVILGLVAGTLLVGFSGSFGKAKHELAKSGIGIVVTQLEKYKLEHSAWPSNEQGLAVLSDGQAKPTDAYYLARGQLLDPWERPYLYITPGPEGHPYEVLTYGADSQPGGEGEDADISSADLRGKKQ